MLLCSSDACFCSLTYFNVFALNSAMSVPDVGTLPKSPFPVSKRSSEVSKCPFLCHFVHFAACHADCPLRAHSCGRFPLSAAEPRLTIKNATLAFFICTCPIFIVPLYRIWDTNIYSEGELQKESTVAKFAIVPKG